MATNVSLTNITRKAVRVGTTNLPANGPAVATAVSVDLESLGFNGRHNLQDLIASGSVIAGADPTALKVTNIALGSRNFANASSSRKRLDATNLAALTLVSLNVRTLTNFGRQDLQRLLAAGCLLTGDSTGTANVTLYNLSSKRLRVGTTFIPPVRIAGAYQATDIITLSPVPVVGAGYKLTYNGVQIATEYVQGTNLTAAAIQTDLRLASGGDPLAVVTGTTDTGPFTVTYSKGFVPLSAITVAGSAVNTITLTGTGATTTFKLTYAGSEGATVFTNASNQTAAAIQAALRGLAEATLDNVRVSGTTNTGPFVLVQPVGVAFTSNVTVTSPTNGIAGSTAATAMAGTDVQNTTQPSALVIPDVTALTVAQCRDLQWLLAAGQILSV